MKWIKYNKHNNYKILQIDQFIFSSL